MMLRQIFRDRYAVLHNLKPRTEELFEQSLDRFRDFLGREAEVSDLNDLTISKFVRWRGTTPHRGRIVSPASVRKDLSHITALWNHCCKKRLKGADGELLEFPDLPRNLVKVPRRIPRGYLHQEVEALAKAGLERRRSIGPVPGRWFWPTLVMAAWYTGARIGSLLGVRWGDVDLDARQIVFRAEEYKGGVKTIVRAIPDDLVELLRAGKAYGSDLVWPWREYRHGKTSIFTALRMLCAMADVTPRGFHAIRKASGSYVHARGGSAQDHLAHEDERTTRQSYLDPKIAPQQSALNLLPKINLGDGPEKPAA